MTDEATFSKFLRFFTSRLVQTLVQARLGIKIKQECTGTPGQTDWFNTKIDELGEIAAYLRSAIEEFPPKCEAVTIEFLLYTADGVHLPLESWVVSVDNEDSDPDANVNADFYHRLGTILRSVATATRMTPMYRYFVKRQSQDTFVILYRIYKGTMDADLGKEAKHLSIAVLPSPFGTLNLDLSYRTNMTLPSNIESKGSTSLAEEQSTDSLPYRPSFSDCVPVVGGEKEDCPSLTTPNFRASPAQTPTSATSQPRFRIGRSSSSDDSTQSLHISTSLDTKECAFGPQKPITRRTESFPFEQLLASSLSPPKRQLSCCEASCQPGAVTSLPKIKETVLLHQTEPEANKMQLHEITVDDEDQEDDGDESYVKMFDTVADNTANLSHFIKECRTAPTNLPGFMGDSAASLAEQLRQFSIQEKEFTAFLSSMQKNEGSH